MADAALPAEDTASLLHDAIVENYYDEVYRLLQAGANPKLGIPTGDEGKLVEIPLFLAAFKGWLDIVELLIRFGADVNQLEESQGYFFSNQSPTCFFL